MSAKSLISLDLEIAEYRHKFATGVNFGQMEQSEFTKLLEERERIVQELVCSIVGRASELAR
jgi:hypothetical protein